LFAFGEPLIANAATAVPETFGSFADARLSTSTGRGESSLRQTCAIAPRPA